MPPHMPTEGGNEKASEFLLRMAVHPDLRPADKKKMREVAYLFISLGEQLTQLREENERLVRQINDPRAANEEIPF